MKVLKGGKGLRKVLCFLIADYSAIQVKAQGMKVSKLAKGICNG